MCRSSTHFCGRLLFTHHKNARVCLERRVTTFSQRFSAERQSLDEESEKKCAPSRKGKVLDTQAGRKRNLILVFIQPHHSPFDRRRIEIESMMWSILCGCSGRTIFYAQCTGEYSIVALPGTLCWSRDFQYSVVGMHN